MSFVEWLLGIFSTVSQDEKHYKAGMNFMESEEFARATGEFVSALRIKPTEEKHHDAYGKSLYKQEMIDKADIAFGIADNLGQIKKIPTDVKALCRLALAFQDKRMFSLSQKYIQRALALKPENERVQFLLGRANYLGNKFKEAIEQYNKVIKLNPYFVDVYYGLRDVYGSQGKSAKQKEYDELAKQVQQVVTSPDDPDAHAELGEIFQKHSNTSSAEIEFKEALKLDDKCLKALRGIGILKYKKGDYNKAKKLFLQATIVKKYDSELHSYLGLIYRLDANTKIKSEWELALARQLKDLEKTKDKDKFGAYINVADFFFKGNKMDDAEELYNTALKINSKSPELFVKLAILYLKCKKSKEALDYCEKAIKLAPDKETGYIGKGLVLMGMDDLDPAVALFQEALGIAPKTPKIHEYLAQAYTKKGLDKLADKEMRIKGSLESGEQEVI